MGGREEAAEPFYRTEPGSVLANRYRILGPIGRGGMGSVHLAEDERLGGKLRAVKLTKPLPEEREAFIAEARLLGRLQHPNLPQIVDYFPPDPSGVACIVMDYVAGDTLGERWVQMGGRIPYPTLLRYMLQLCDVLRYLHAQDPPVVFRDLKPGNVLIDARDRAILVDFGIARLYRAGAESDTLKLGTPGFAAPEQLKGEQSDARTDLYGLGAVVYYLLAGGSFAYRRNRRAKLDRIVPPRFAELLERLLAERPEDRPASADELYRELETLAAEVGEGEGLHEGSGLRPGFGTSEARMGGGLESGLGSGWESGWGTARGAQVYAFVSAYPGAGASFVASALSARLAELEAPHALVECPGGEPELYYALDGDRNRPTRAAYADPAGELPFAPSWKNGTAAYYPLDPGSAGMRPPEKAFASWLRRLGPAIVLLDVSSRWETPGVAEWVGAYADRLYVVADCLPAKWNTRRQRAVARMEEAACRRGAGIGWIANRDHDFPSREEWIGTFPAKPLLAMPVVPLDEVSRALWRGLPVRPVGRTAERMDRFIRKEWVEKRRGIR